MKFSTNNRYVLFAVLILLYFIPIIFFSVYSIAQMSKVKSWMIVSIGLVLISFCSLIFFLFLLHWDKAIKGKLKKQTAHRPEALEKENKVTSLDQALLFEEFSTGYKLDSNPIFSKESHHELLSLRINLAESQEKITLIREQLALKENEQQAYLEENKRLENKAEKISQDFSDYKLFCEEQLKQKNLQLTTAQLMIEGQRTEIERRQEQICHLDSKIHDLSYEIKTLIHLHETDSSPPTPSFLKVENSLRNLSSSSKSKIETVLEIFPEEWNRDCPANESRIHTAPEAWLLLRKCVNIAQKLTGANYYGNESSRFREFSSSHFTIDQRRLFDSLRNENAGLILVYSQKENKLLFANNQTKNFLGCSPDKFINDFGTFFQDGLIEWRKALSVLSNSSESQARLLVRTKQGSEVILNSHFGVVPTGLFRNYVICVLYPT